MTAPIYYHVWLNEEHTELSRAHILDPATIPTLDQIDNDPYINRGQSLCRRQRRHDPVEDLTGIDPQPGDVCKICARKAGITPPAETAETNDSVRAAVADQAADPGPYYANGRLWPCTIHHDKYGLTVQVIDSTDPITGQPVLRGTGYHAAGGITMLNRGTTMWTVQRILTAREIVQAITAAPTA